LKAGSALDAALQAPQVLIAVCGSGSAARVDATDAGEVLQAVFRSVAFNLLQ